MDFNKPGGRFGAGYYHFNTRDGIRESAANTFLGPILDSKTGESTRSNFRLMLDTTVTVRKCLVDHVAFVDANDLTLQLLAWLENQNQ